MVMIVRVVNSNPVTGITNSFNVEKMIQMDMGMYPETAPYRGYVSLIVAQVSNISDATTITIRVCRDQLGDQCIVTDTTSSIFTGLTTATKGSACWALNAFAGVEENDQLFCFIKSNNGSFDLDYLEITWGDNK
ncbi:MAG: hypothetical protein CL605_00120 [Altibacter sp.]|nr:hypothetical protein [Altibacter sp.]